MATTIKYLPQGPLRTVEQQTQTSSTPGAAALRENLPTTEAMREVRRSIADLYNQIGTAYTNLINAGRTSEAMRLREVAEKFARTGSEAGISPAARVAALENLKTTMRVAGMEQEAQRTADMIASQSNNLAQLSAVEQQIFGGEMDRFSAALQTLPRTTVTTTKQAASPMVLTTPTASMRSPAAAIPAVSRARTELDARLASLKASPAVASGPLPVSGGYIAPKATAPVSIAPVSSPATAPVSGIQSLNVGVASRPSAHAPANLGVGSASPASPSNIGQRGTGVLTTADGRQVILDATGKITVGDAPSPAAPAATPLSVAQKKGYEALPTSWDVPAAAYSPIKQAGAWVEKKAGGLGSTLAEMIYGK